MMYAYGYNWFPHSFFGGIFMILFWVAVVYFIIWAVKNVSSGNKEIRSNGDGKALELLRERYVKGELTKEQFESIKKDITS